MSAHNRCEDCFWWDKKEPQHIYGDCRRQPPQFNLTVNVRRDQYTDGRDTITISRFPNAQWPNTSKDDWCGEWGAAP